MPKDLYTQSVVFDAEAKEMLETMAAQDDRTNSALVRYLIRQEWARRFSQPNPAVPLAEALQAGQELE